MKIKIIAVLICINLLFSFTFEAKRADAFFPILAAIGSVLSSTEFAAFAALLTAGVVFHSEIEAVDLSRSFANAKSNILENIMVYDYATDIWKGQVSSSVVAEAQDFMTTYMLQSQHTLNYTGNGYYSGFWDNPNDRMAFESVYCAANSLTDFEISGASWAVIQSWLNMDDNNYASFKMMASTWQTGVEYRVFKDEIAMVINNQMYMSMYVGAIDGLRYRMYGSSLSIWIHSWGSWGNDFPIWQGGVGGSAENSACLFSMAVGYAQYSDVVISLTSTSTYTSDLDYTPSTVKDYDLAIPGDTTIDGILDKSLEDFETTAEIPTTPDISGIFSFLQSLLDALLAIKSFLAGFISSLVAALSEAVLGGDEGINWEPIRHSLNLFTNKFPFSLPWDLQRMLSNFNQSNTVPHFDINIDAGIFKWNQSIDLSIFSPLIGTVRAFLLIAFNLGLVIGTRKWLGGDA
ncbi:MAG: hypothetical protein LBT22_08445 [Peptococcaceae bacterium]|nr:hypothetical protein [Peptococcaceae bacterium]